MKKLLFIPLLVTALLTVGCASNSAFNPATQVISDKEFIQKSPEERYEYTQSLRDNSVILAEKKRAEYLAEMPVYTGTKDAGHTLIWNRQLQVVDLYSGHLSKQVAMERQSQTQFLTNENGDLLLQSINGVMKPTPILTSSQTQEDLGRVLVKGGLNILGASLNGAVAAEIMSNEQCGSDCGGDITLVNQGGVSTSEAIAGAISNSAVNAVVGGCSTGKCTPVPMD